MNKKLFVPFLLIAMLLLTACTPPRLSNTGLIPSTGSTQPAVTATAFTPEVLPTLIPTETATAIPTATATPFPTDTPTPTQSPTATSVPPTAAPVIACNLARFIGDVTIPDGTVIDPGASFTKTWRLQNVGSCAWTTGYEVVFSNGDLMSGSTAVALPGNVNPGDTVDVSVDLVAPNSAGTYQGDYLLRDPSGDYFGTGSDSSHRFWVNIVVGSTTVYAVTSADVTANPATFSGDCPSTFWFSSNIVTNGAGTVTYYWLRSDGSQSPEATLTFSGAGYQAVSDSWTLGVPGAAITGSDQLYIDQPNNQYFGSASFSLSCTPAPTATATTAPTATATTAPTSTVAPTAAPTATATIVPTVTVTTVPTATATSTPTVAPTATATTAPTATATATEFAKPTATATTQPTTAPKATIAPTTAATAAPTKTSTPLPPTSTVVAPTAKATVQPTANNP